MDLWPFAFLCESAFPSQESLLGTLPSAQLYVSNQVTYSPMLSKRVPAAFQNVILPHDVYMLQMSETQRSLL